MLDEARSDDASIADDDQIWRRIAPIQIIFDDNLGRFRPTSGAFRGNGRLFCVYVARLVEESGRSAESILDERWPESSMATLAAVAFRARGLGIAAELDPDYPDETAHAVVFGKTRRPSRKLCKEAKWAVLRAKADRTH